MHLLDELNEQQRAAVTAAPGPLLIMAGPGTGKTKTLAARIAYLLDSGVPADELVALTYTNKAAREMRERVAALIGTTKGLPIIATFHALCQRLLTEHGETGSLVSNQQRTEILKTLSRPAAFKKRTPRELELIISTAKTALAPPADEPLQQLLTAYQAALTEHGVQDFDDLLLRGLQRLSTSQVRYSHVLVDEFQDTSDLQYAILKLLSSAGHVVAIGDPRQSIYSFRGAGMAMFERFRADFPNARTVALAANYRSAPEIVAAANAIFPSTAPLIPQATVPGTVRALQTLNEYSEAAYIIGEVEQGIGGSDMLKAGTGDATNQPRDYAVLYRSRRAARTLHKAFAESGLPYQIAGEGSPYERPDVQAVIAALRENDNPNGLPVYDLAVAAAARLDVPSESLRQLFGTFVQFGSDVAACLKHIDAMSEQEFYDPSANAVSLMTIHASKGLEFEHVFLLAAEEDILPQGNTENIAEEQRLFYVAATRARTSLTVLHAKTRAGKPAVLSRFVAELSEAVLPRSADPAMVTLENRLKKRAARRAQATLF